jgi:hypothetical protein
MGLPLEPMSPDFDLAALVRKQLTRDEVAHGVAYVADAPLPRGTHLDFPKTPIDLQCKGFVIFVDREPTANWTHSCRYLIIDAERGNVKSVEAQLPPFGRAGLRWRVVYRAPGIPDPHIAVPQQAPK